VPPYTQSAAEKQEMGRYVLAHPDIGKAFAAALEFIRKRLAAAPQTRAAATAEFRSRACSKLQALNLKIPSCAN
jgi:hypothetical protein